MRTILIFVYSAVVTFLYSHRWLLDHPNSLYLPATTVLHNAVFTIRTNCDTVFVFVQYFLSILIDPGCLPRDNAHRFLCLDAIDSHYYYMKLWII